jgi:2-polyprenyl-6-methoxyphenol hydroxylase-like FAD-dependent oxidoreductase
MQSLTTRCCIVGGGPAGMMAGFLLARAGVDVVVLEKHPDFFRDFRGDTIHPSTLQMLHDVGLLDRFLARPHNELTQISGRIGSDVLTIADFSRLPTVCKFVAFMPQWDFLDFLRDCSVQFPSYRLLMNTRCTGLLYERHRVCGVRASGPDGEIEIRSDLVIGTDGRGSLIRERAGLQVKEYGAPMDVLWMRIPKGRGDVNETLGVVGGGHILVLIDRGEYWQAAFVIAKGTYDNLRGKPVTQLRERIASLAPFLRERLETLQSWDDVRLLEVRVDRLDRWYAPGVLCIGDAAHAMSPIGGVGVNIAIQDAVATANLLWQPLLHGAPDETQLRSVQERRLFAAKATQAVQLFIQRVVVRRVLGAVKIERAPLVLRLLTSIPAWRYRTARLIGLGFRPERIQSPLRTSAPQ